MEFKTGIYLGSNIDDSSYERILKMENTLLIASTVFPERAPLNYKDKLHYFDESLAVINELSFDFNLIKKVSSDYNLSLLWSRFHRDFRKKYNTEISRFEFQLSLIHSSISFIERHNLKTVFFAYEPHSLSIYIFKKVCIEMGIRSATLKVSPFPSRLFAIDDKKQTILENKMESTFSLENFIKSRKFNETKKHVKKKNPFRYPLNQSIYYNFKYHKYLLKHITQRNQIFQNSFIVFFLHYQPELTTLPDGEIFVSQFEAIKVLSKLCEKFNYNLVIREHPDTVKYFNKNWRNKSFIYKIKNLGEHVIIDDFRKSNLEILKKCKGVGTITGTVINESLINGIPVIVFGNHPFKGWNGKSLVQFNGSLDGLISSFKTATQLEQKEIIQEVKEYLLVASKQSFGGDFLGIEKDGEIASLWFNRYKAFVDFVKYYL
jgi:hypothetical protein